MMDDWDGFHNRWDNRFGLTNVILWTTCAVAAVVIIAIAAGLMSLGLWLAGVC